MPCSEDDDSQSGIMSDNNQGLSKAELRKTNKPIMEKKRRARINNCLNELKDLLLGTSVDKDPSRHSKLEKADILELTVKHLQTLQRQQLAAAIAADPAVLHRFKAGFGDCAHEVRKYLSRLASVPTGLRNRLGNHLNTCISGIQHLNPPDLPPLFPDPLRLEDDRPSAFHCVKSTKPTSPPLSPISCDSACDSSTELETPPRPVQTFPFPTPPSRSASDQDSSPDTQKSAVSSTTISPETLKQEAMKSKKYMEPLSIVIDVENYKIGIDASPKRAVDYSMRHKLKRPAIDISGPVAKILKVETEKSFPATERISDNSIKIPERQTEQRDVCEIKRFSPEKSAFGRFDSKNQSYPIKQLKIPNSIPSAYERTRCGDRSVNDHNSIVSHDIVLPRSVISHTAESLAMSSASTSREDPKLKERVEPDTSTRSPERGSSASEMWRPW